MKYLCNCCPRQCGAVRTEDTNTGGFCNMPLYPKIARADLYFWEEPCISGKNGSGTVFFSGCSLRCVYCQNYEISHNNGGILKTPEELAEIMRELENKGAHNINFVNPTHCIWAIREAIKIYKPSIPLIYNSGGYDNVSVIEEDIFDIYLMDLKYVSSDISFKYSAAANYFDKASAAIKAAYKLKGEPQMKNGIMQSGLIIRHLVLPMNTRETLKVIDWVAENVRNAYFSLMAQYIPCGKAAEFKELNRPITEREYNKTVDYLCGKNLRNVYIQDRKSAKDSYIPKFDLGE